MKVLELPMCPACGSSSFEEFMLGARFRLRRCAGCETVSALDYADPTEVYVDGYMFGEAGQFGLDVRAPLFQQYLLRVAQRRVNMIEKATELPRGALLDVGSGTGEVLLAATEHGWSARGVEPERTAAEMAHDRGQDVTVSTLERSGIPERSFEVVSAFHVLEHMPDSRGFLRMMSRWVRPGGFLVVEVPNWSSVQRRRLRSDWPGVRPREHLVHFTPKTLAKTLRSAGAEPIFVKTPSYVGPPQSLEDALRDIVRLGRYRRLVEPLSRVQNRDGREPARYPTRAGWAVLRATEAVYNRAGVGSVVFCVAEIPA